LAKNHGIHWHDAGYIDVCVMAIVFANALSARTGPYDHLS